MHFNQRRCNFNFSRHSDWMPAYTRKCMKQTASPKYRNNNITYATCMRRVYVCIEVDCTYIYSSSIINSIFLSISAAHTRSHALKQAHIVYVYVIYLLFTINSKQRKQRSRLHIHMANTLGAHTYTRTHTRWYVDIYLYRTGTHTHRDTNKPTDSNHFIHWVHSYAEAHIKCNTNK